MSIIAYLMFSLGSGVIAGYIAGRLEDLGRFAVSLATLGLTAFFFLFLGYLFFLRVFAHMPNTWTSAVVWGHYPLLILALTFGWQIARQRHV